MARRWTVWIGWVAVGVGVLVSVEAVGPPAVAVAAWAATAAAWWGLAHWGVTDRPTRWLARGGVSLLALAWTGIAVEPFAPALGVPAPLVLALLALLASLLVVGALLRAVTLRSQGHVIDGWLEGLLVAGALAMLVAELLFSPHLGPVGSEIDAATALAPPLVMALAVGVAVRLLLSGAERLPAAWLLLLTTVVSLAADTLYSLGGGTASSAVLRGWAAAYLLAATALAHPSIGTLVRRPVERPVLSSRRPWVQLGFIAVALLIPAALLTNQALATTAQPLTSLAASALLLLVLWRLARLLRQQHADAEHLERRAEQLRRRAEHQQALAEVSRTSLDVDTPHALVRSAADAAGTAIGVPCRGLANVWGEPGESGVGAARIWPLHQAHGLVCDPPPERALDAVDQQFLDAVAAIAASGLRRLETERDLRHQSLHDPLTGLANRTLIGDRLALALAAAAREADLTGVVFADLDGFKAINDTYGHAVGDAVLTAVAESLTAVVRRGDTVGRISGDEFVIIAPAITPDGLDELAVRTLEAIKRAEGHLPERAADVRLTASVGTALGHHSTNPDRLLAEADAAMYRVKRRGGDDHSPAPRYHTTHDPPYV